MEKTINQNQLTASQRPGLKQQQRKTLGGRDGGLPYENDGYVPRTS